MTISNFIPKIFGDLIEGIEDSYRLDLSSKRSSSSSLEERMEEGRAYDREVECLGKIRDRHYNDLKDLVREGKDKSECASKANYVARFDRAIKLEKNKIRFSAPRTDRKRYFETGDKGFTKAGMNVYEEALEEVKKENRRELDLEKLIFLRS